MKKVVSAVLVAVVLMLGANKASAQSPSEQFGFGGYVSGGGISAFQIQYAFTPAFHLGTGIGLAFQGGGSTVIFAPYGKFIFAGQKELKPYLQASIVIASFGTTNSTNSTSTSLNLGGGAEYFITPNFGTFLGMTVVSLPLSPSGDPAFGFLMPTLGVEWFL